MRTTILNTVLFLSISAAWAGLVVDSPGVRIGISDAGLWTSIVEKSTGRECCDVGAGKFVCAARVDGQTRNPKSVTATPVGMRVEFEDVDTILVYEIAPARDWIVFRLATIEGTRPEQITLLRVPAAITENLGRRLNCAWDQNTSLCVMAANRSPDCRGAAGKPPLLEAQIQDAPGPRFESAAVALIACPTSRFKQVARDASRAFGLLTNEDADGTPVKDTDLVRGSYFFLSFGEKDVDKVIDYCNRAGIRQVMLSSPAWCKDVGHYTFREYAYPNGIAGLKGVVGKLHENGILVGMHCFASKISKTDAYVTPVPDKRFWRKFATRLAQDISADQTEIRVDPAANLKDWAGSSATASKYWEGGVDKHREVVIGDEIIQYESVGPDGVWDTFNGCRRGAWGTTAAAHQAGDDAVHYGVDGCINGFIVDQETDLIDETMERMSSIFNECGFDMVYFDGGEDVDTRRFNYYVSNFQEQAMKRFTKRPIIHMGTVMTHLLWHSFARSSTVDHYLNTLFGAISGGKPPKGWPTVRDHINVSVRYMQSVHADMMPGELGWFGIWPRGVRSYTVRLSEKEADEYRAMGCEEPTILPSRGGIVTGQLTGPDRLLVTVQYDGLQLDEMEYLMCKSLGYDAPVSLQTDFRSMEAHRLTPEILEIFRTYEDLRMNRRIDPETCERLQEMDRDFALIVWQGERHFPEVRPVEGVGGGREARACVGGFGEGSVATLWHAFRDGFLALDLDPAEVSVISLAGNTIPCEVVDGKLRVPVNTRRSALVCPNLSPEQLAELLRQGEMVSRPHTAIFVRADTAEGFEGKMALGAQVGVSEPEAFGDVLVCTGRPTLGEINEWYAQYTVDIPHEGNWTLWARVRYPSGADESFGIVLPGDPVTLTGNQVLGNCGVNERKWHWTGAGGGSTSVPPGSPITFSLPAGPFTFRIYAREGSGTAAMNPRLDLLCLTDEADAVPTDDEARKGL